MHKSALNLDDELDIALVCQDSPYCHYTPEQRELAQKNNCVWCSRVFVDSKGNAECIEPYFEVMHDD